jgi:hypothetical protein
VNAPADEVRSVVRQAPVELLQFQGDETSDFCRRFGRPYIKAVRVQPGVDLLQYARDYHDAKALLLDAYVEGLHGGSGVAFDWSRIPGGLPLPVIVSGVTSAQGTAPVPEAIDDLQTAHASPPDAVTLAWRPVADALTYTVYRDDALLAEIAEARFVDTEVSPGSVHRYVVEADVLLEPEPVVDPDTGDTVYPERWDGYRMHLPVAVPLDDPALVATFAGDFQAATTAALSGGATSSGFRVRIGGHRVGDVQGAEPHRKVPSVEVPVRAGRGRRTASELIDCEDSGAAQVAVAATGARGQFGVCADRRLTRRQAE